jgi:hypothetical protein
MRVSVKNVLLLLGGLFVAYLVVGVTYVAIFEDEPERDAPTAPRVVASPPTQDKSPQAKRDEGDVSEAWVMATNFVKDSLKSPSTAKWGWQTGRGNEGERVAYHGNGTYTVSGWVDSQNAFGATVRTNWTVGLKDHGSGKWTATSGPTFSER